MAATRQRSNADVVRACYEAFEAGDLNEIAGMMADDIEWIEPEGSPYAGTYHGFEEIAANVFEPSMERVERFRVDADRYVDCGDTIVVLGSFRGTSPADDESFEIPFAHVCEVEDGKLTAFQNYTDTAAWNAVLDS